MVEHQSLVSRLAPAARGETAIPPMPTGLSLEAAYSIQRQLVETVDKGTVAGLKAGLTAKQAQAVFGATHPLIGSLYSWGRLESGCCLNVVPGLCLECEIGIVVDTQGNPKSAGPVVEVPRLDWSKAGDATAENLTAFNIGASRYIVGEFRPMRSDYSDLFVTLRRNGETVCEAPLSDALGGPHLGLQWMLSEARLRGLDIADNMLLITGACGGIQPAKAGSYRADYGDLGTIRFRVL